MVKVIYMPVDQVRRTYACQTMTQNKAVRQKELSHA